MAIRLEDLPPKYREKVSQMEIERRRKLNKYRNQAASAMGIKFDSKAEERRFFELFSLYRAGAIQEFKVHPVFTLIEAYTKPTGEKVRRMSYTADFSYLRDRKLVVEDVKSRPTRTTDYQMRKKLMLDKYGITIQEIT